jgi:hypothetical protein
MGLFSAIYMDELPSRQVTLPSLSLEWCQVGARHVPGTNLAPKPVIIRKRQDHLLLITQPDHARLAAALMASWQADGLPASPRRDDILLATLRHDDGWVEEDVTPIAGETGELLDFVRAPDPVRQRVWPRAVGRLAGTPYAAALVAQHALSIYHAYRGQPAWQAFFDGMEVLLNRHLIATNGVDRVVLRADYRFVRWGDLLSLTFANEWTEPQSAEGYAIRWDGTHLMVAPDPFGGRTIPMTLNARQLPNRPFMGQDEAAAAFVTAPLVTIEALVRGLPA